MRKSAFLSYSLQDSELYTISIISKYLNEQGFFVQSANKAANFPGRPVLDVVRRAIINANLFIGIASTEGVQSEYMIREWEEAQRYNVPRIFIIENSVNLNPAFTDQNTVIRFDRRNPQQSLNRLKAMVENQKKNSAGKILPWVVGGLLGMAVIKLLSDNNK